jgi:hypothetical protein
MKVISKLSCSVYLYEMKQQLGSFSAFGTERFTGIIIGRFFSITYHSGHEFNRRITNEKHRAIGFAWPCENGTEISCIRLAGMTNPLSLIGLFIFCNLICMLRGGLELALMPEMMIANAAITLTAALITAFTDSITERGQEGSKMLTAFLVDPIDYYSLM